MKKYLYLGLFIASFVFYSNAKADQNITLVSPNGGEAFANGAQVSINWSVSADYACKTIVLYLFPQAGTPTGNGYISIVGGYNIGGKTYSCISTSSTRNDTLTVALPSVPSGYYKVGVYVFTVENNTNPVNAVALDLSNAQFSIGTVTSDANSRYSRRISDMAQLRLALELYYDAYSSYPVSLYSLAPTYIPNVPSDPLGNMYFYHALNDGCTGNASNSCKNYHLAVNLETPTNSALSSDADENTSSLPGGINGADSGPCRATGVTGYCYDVVATPIKPFSPIITVTAPNGGEVWQTGSVQTIRWSTSGYPANTPASIVLFSKDTGGTVQIIDEVTDNDGIENILVPEITTGNNYFIQVGCVSAALYPQYTYPNGCNPDSSDSPFSITQGSVISPTADLVISNLKVQPINPTVNQRINISFDVENRGIASSVKTSQYPKIYGIDSGSQGIGIITNSISDGCRATVELPPKSACHIEMTGFYDSPGQKVLSISADPFNEVNEIGESNNKTSVNILVLSSSATVNPPTSTPIPVPTPTPSPSDNSATIQSLLQQIQALQNQINSLKSQVGNTAPQTSSGNQATNGSENIPVSSCLDISNNLTYRSRDVSTGGDVSALQDFLQAKGYLNSEPTGFFGVLTLQAVKNFQQANGISSTGFAGPLTRAKIKSLTCGQ